MTTLCFATTKSATKGIVADNTIVNKDAFEKLSWVLRARAGEKDDVKHLWQLRKLHTRDRYIFCTDSFRIHKLNYSPSFFLLEPDSFYTVVKQTSNVIVLRKNDTPIDKGEFDIEKFLTDDYEEVFSLSRLYNETTFVTQTMFGFAFHVTKMFNPKFFYDSYIYSNKEWVGKVKLFDKPSYVHCRLFSGEFEILIASMWS